MKIAYIAVKIFNIFLSVLKFAYKLSYYFSIPFILIGRKIKEADRRRSRMIEDECRESRISYAVGKGYGLGMAEARMIERERREGLRRARRALFGR